MKNSILAIILAFIFTHTASAQSSKYQLRAEYFKPVNLFSFSNPTVNGFHFPKNFGLALGVERDWKTTRRRTKYQTATVGFYNLAYFERVITVESNIGWRFRIYKGLQTGFEMGAAYNRGTNSNLVSVYEDNKWISKVDKSVVTNRFVPNVGLNIGYDFSQHFGEKIPVTVQFTENVQGLLPFIKDVAPVGLMRNNKLILKYRF